MRFTGREGWYVARYAGQRMSCRPGQCQLRGWPATRKQWCGRISWNYFQIARHSGGNSRSTCGNADPSNSTLARVYRENERSTACRPKPSTALEKISKMTPPTSSISSSNRAIEQSWKRIRKMFPIMDNLTPPAAQFAYTIQAAAPPQLPAGVRAPASTLRRSTLTLWCFPRLTLYRNPAANC